jgi:hypothetical protein
MDVTNSLIDIATNGPGLVPASLPRPASKWELLRGFGGNSIPPPFHGAGSTLDSISLTPKCQPVVDQSPSNVLCSSVFPPLLTTVFIPPFACFLIRRTYISLTYGSHVYIIGGQRRRCHEAYGLLRLLHFVAMSLTLSNRQRMSESRVAM